MTEYMKNFLALLEASNCGLITPQEMCDALFQHGVPTDTQVLKLRYLQEQLQDTVDLFIDIME